MDSARGVQDQDAAAVREVGPPEASTPAADNEETPALTGPVADDVGNSAESTDAFLLGDNAANSAVTDSKDTNLEPTAGIKAPPPQSIASLEHVQPPLIPIKHPDRM